MSILLGSIKTKGLTKFIFWTDFRMINALQLTFSGPIRSLCKNCSWKAAVLLCRFTSPCPPYYFGMYLCMYPMYLKSTFFVSVELGHRKKIHRKKYTEKQTQILSQSLLKVFLLLFLPFYLNKEQTF